MKVRKKSGQAGYVLLALMLAVTMILIALSIAAPRIAQRIKREKEEELYHRGMDYATAIKRFVHKSGGRYPLSVEQLEDTNHIRFLRKRYKDPMTGEDNWRLVHFGEAEIKVPTTQMGGLQTTNNPGLGGGTNSGLGGNRTSGLGGNTNSGLGGNTNSGFGGGTTSGLGGNTTSGFGGGTTSGLGSNTTSGFGGGTTSGLGSQSGGGVGQNGQLGSLNTSNIGNGIGNGQGIGGGQIIGVASTSKKQGIKEFNDKDHYNDWFFVYDLRLEQSGGTGTTVAAPRAGLSDTSGQAGQQAQPGGSSFGSNPQPGAQQPVGTPTPAPSIPN
jgi:type II secretory pathway pseudopilin PulG